jgi:DNA/RNA-binding domain of Phe-tRNA-synthetase-like protein
MAKAAKISQPECEKGSIMEIKFTNRWRETFSGGHIGLLSVAGVNNAGRSPALEQHKREVEVDLRQKYADMSRADLLELEVFEAYKAYYKKFKKTYHVLLQLESVLYQGKSLPAVSPLVDAGFAAELETLVLTAGHDADLLVEPVMIDAADGSEVYRLMNGNEQQTKAGDMLMRDAVGVVCTIIYGQDQRTPISASTRRALYVAYAPAGVRAAAVQNHLETIHDNVQLIAPQASIEYLHVEPAI